MGKTSSNHNKDYFVFPHPFWVITILFEIWLLGWAILGNFVVVTSLAVYKFNMGKTSQNYNKDYFVFPHPFWVIAILFGIWLLGISTFAPDRIPWFLGPVGEFGKHVGKTYPLTCMGLCVMTVVIHCAEAAYAEKLCIDKRLSLGASIKWTLQTLIFGFASLIRLKPYSPEKKIS